MTEHPKPRAERGPREPKAIAGVRLSQVETVSRGIAAQVEVSVLDPETQDDHISITQWAELSRQCLYQLLGRIMRGENVSEALPAALRTSIKAGERQPRIKMAQNDFSSGVPNLNTLFTCTATIDAATEKVPGEAKDLLYVTVTAPGFSSVIEVALPFRE